MLNSICPSFDIWHTSLVTNLNLKLVFWSQLWKPVFNPLHCPYILPIFHQFISENVTENGVEHLAKSKINSIQCLPLIHHESHHIIEVYEIGHAWFLLYKSLLMTSNYFLVLYVLGDGLEEDSVHCFHQKKERLTGLCCTGYFLQEGRTDNCFLPVHRNPPYLPQAFKADQDCSCTEMGQLPQHSEVHQVPGAHVCLVLFKCTWVDSYCPGIPENKSYQ